MLLLLRILRRRQADRRTAERTTRKPGSHANVRLSVSASILLVIHSISIVDQNVNPVLKERVLMGPMAPCSACPRDSICRPWTTRWGEANNTRHCLESHIFHPVSFSSHHPVLISLYSPKTVSHFPFVRRSKAVLSLQLFPHWVFRHAVLQNV